LGKPLGVMLAVALLVVPGLAKLPEGATWRDMFGVACLAGIGFTMSLFIGSLAFADPDLGAQVRIGVVAGSALSIAIGLAVLLPARRAT
jgi:Na+:H+ antiporter, NhaA family